MPVTPETPGRRYLGICAHGVRLKSAEIRLAEILLIAGQTLFDAYGAAADPYMTVVGYFNATRELAGMRRYLDDDVTTRVRAHGRPAGCPTGSVSSTGMLADRGADLPDLLGGHQQRAQAAGGGLRSANLDTSAGGGPSAQEFAAARKDKRDPHPLVDRLYERLEAGGLPVDVVLATSMLQVGVDVSRFGLMVVTGQPKNTAEYIQASSRVGRSAEKPGLVVTLYNWSRPRDLAHYEDFEHYHATYYRQVEALSVTPYTRRALDRGTAATFVAAVRNVDRAVLARRRRPGRRPRRRGGASRSRPGCCRRAERASDHRGREYLSERIGALRDRWTDSKTGVDPAGLPQTGGKQPLNGLLGRGGRRRVDRARPCRCRCGRRRTRSTCWSPARSCSTRCSASPPGRSPLPDERIRRRRARTTSAARRRRTRETR